jgi:hypothetical protein
MAEEKDVRAYMPHRTLQKDGSVIEGFAERDVVDALHGPTGNKEPLIVCASAASSPVLAASTTDSTELGLSASRRSPMAGRRLMTGRRTRGGTARWGTP